MKHRIIKHDGMYKVQRYNGNNHMNLLTPAKIQGIKSKSIYWKEVLKREDQSILVDELREVINDLGVAKILLIISEYVNNDYTNAL